MKRGFTLVELSIVLVIIGLLIGGILVAQSMVDSTKVQRFVGEVNQYMAAINNFKVKYRQLPGDSTRFTNPGDGDGTIEYVGAGAAGEWTRIWQHLSESGDLNETYTGGLLTAEGSVPESAAFKDVQYTLFIRASAYGYNLAGHTLHIGKKSSGTWNAYGGISPVNSASIDIKFDDGSADTGDLRIFAGGISPYQPGCMNITGSPPYTSATYNLDNPDGLCVLMYWVEDKLY